MSRAIGLAAASLLAALVAAALLLAAALPALVALAATLIATVAALAALPAALVSTVSATLLTTAAAAGVALAALTLLSHNAILPRYHADFRGRLAAVRPSHPSRDLLSLGLSDEAADMIDAVV